MTIERVSLPDQHYLYVEGEAGADGSGIAEAMGKGFGEVYTFVAEHGIKPVSMPSAIYVEMPSPAGMFFRLGFFVDAVDAASASGNVKAGVIAAGDAFKAIHTGPYDELNKTHDAIWTQMDSVGVERGRPVWEIYVDDPMETDPDQLRTEVFRKVG